MNISPTSQLQNSTANDFVENPHQMWVVNNKEIKLFLGTEPYFTICENNRITNRVELTEAAVRRIHATDQIYIHVMNNKEHYDFCPLLFKRKFNQLKLSLVYSRFGPLWQLYDRNTRETRWQKFSATFVSDACHRKTWNMFEKHKEWMQADIRAIGILKDFEEDFLIKDIVFLKETDTDLPLSLDLEAKAEEERKKVYDLKKEKAWKSPNMERLSSRMRSMNLRLTYPSTGFLLPSENNEGNNNEDPEDLFIYGSAENRNRIEEKEKRFAIYNTIVRCNFLTSDSRSQVLGHRQESLIHGPSHLPSLITKLFCQFLPSTAPKNLLVSEKIRPLVESIFPFYVIVEPRTIPCTLDANVRISKFRWAISLICDDTNAYSGQHALIVVQGIYDGSLSMIDNQQRTRLGERFTLISHLMHENKIKLKFVDKNKLRFIERTRVWLLTSKKITMMVNAMVKERDEQTTPFSILGAYSALGGGGHNCFTWAHSYLKSVGIDLGWPGFGVLFTQTKSYTQKPEYYLTHPDYQKI
ncbi:hypothetical protein [Estrella lausannensis]|uniref:Uncharacterized protein n=1 Tax=Estrella lausannensis TaxID=483423 RepID=A0A0H5DQ32_9BACT|nr:hypothetical protein [Estrella lausannensis]CRX37629.1 hypothetical protein ELAC_0268 [Estrella lausannensis]